MRKLHNYLLVTGCIIGLLLLVTACEKNSEADPRRLGWEYYPLELGQYRIYDVYRINYNFGGENDTLTYELKELVSDYFLDQEQDTVYILKRLQRSALNTTWQLDSTYLVQRTTRWLSQTVNNRPQLQLVFPVADNRTWNGNMLNAAPADSFTMVHVGQPYTIGERTYENSLKVVQEDFLNTIVETDQREEVFARGIGLVYKRTNNIKYCTRQDCTPLSILAPSLFLVMELKDFGKEPL